MQLKRRKENTEKAGKSGKGNKNWKEKAIKMREIKYTWNHISCVSRQSELRFQVFRQKRVQSSDGEDVKDATRRSEHKDVVFKKAFHRLWEI